jgi:hypothetical protein
LSCDRPADLLRLLLAAALGIALPLALLLARGSASAADRAAPAAAPAMRQYYLTDNTSDGNQANGAGVCAAGYHFASLWEIMQTATLSYNTTLGATLADSGDGPPDSSGWVRTGNASGSFTTAGPANCYDWTAGGTGDWGTVARPSDDWTPDQTTFQGWFVETFNCSFDAPVWCVEDMAATGTPSATPVATTPPSATPVPTTSPIKTPTPAPAGRLYLPLVRR